MKRLVVLAVGAGVLAATAAASVPVLLSSDLVKKRVVEQITRWTGRAVIVRGETKISLFPYLTVRLRDVELVNREGVAGPFIRMEALTSKLRLLPLLAGRTEFAEFRLVKPHIDLEVDEAGRPNWLMKSGTIAAQAAFADSNLPTPNAGMAKGGARRETLALGRFVVRDGTIAYRNASTGARELINDVNLQVTWPSTAEPASGNGSLIWNGQAVDFNGSIQAPLALVAGGASSIRLAIAAPTLRASLNGTALNLDDLQFDGAATITTPSIRRLAAWLGRPMVEGSTLGTASIAGRVSWARPVVSFTEATIELDGNQAEGAITATFVDGRPQILGTLAFETLDLSAYVEAFHARLAAGPWAIMSARLPLIENASDIDLRISTGQILVGSLRIGEAAAAVTLKDSRLAVDIGQAEFYGGDVQASFEAEMKDGGLAASAEAEISDVHTRPALAGLAGSSTLGGTGTASIDLTAQGRSWGEILGRLSGTASVALEQGAIAGVDLGRLSAAGMPALPRNEDGATPFTRLAGILNVRGGAITTEDFRGEGDGFRITLGASGSLLDAVLAGKGTLTLIPATGDDSAGVAEIPFQIGGTWVEPAILPDHGTPPSRGATGAILN